MSAGQVATVDPQNMVTADQSRCLHCGMHIVLNTQGEWQHTMSGIVACQPAWRPRRLLALLKGGKS